MVKKSYIGLMVLVLLTASIYIALPENVRIDVGRTYSTFKVWEDESWVLAGQEYTLMFDGTKKMRASSRDVEHFVYGEIIKIVRTANFKDNVTVIDTYTVHGGEDDVELFPISHDINVLNGEGYILVYEVRKLDYSGETVKGILSPQEFGHNMKVEWDIGNYYSRIWGYSGMDEGKLTVKYRPDSNNFTKNVRLFDPPGEDSIGYSFLDNDTVVNIWNDKYDYFFDKDSGMQLTNHYEDYWTRNVFCVGYYDNDVWNKIKCADDLSGFNRNIQTDNNTYVNATIWKDITYQGYDLRMGVKYHLGLYDENLSVTIYAKNLGVDIPFDLGFAWQVKDVSIPGLGADYIDVNGGTYPLSGTYNVSIENMDGSYFNIHDITKFLRLDWDNGLDYEVQMFGNGNQEDFYVSTLINAGHFNPGQEKSTTFQWIDADTLVINSVGTNDNTNGLWGPYWINPTQASLIAIDADEDVSFVITEDGGETWQNTVIEVGLVVGVAAWFDQETPDDKGELINVVWLDDTNDNFQYTTININNGSIGDIVTINGSLTISDSGLQQRLALTKALNGDLLAAVSTQVEIGFYRSNDSGATWTKRADVYESGTEEDWLLLYPADTGTNSDVAGIFWDKNADVISLKMYNDTTNAWTETTINNSMVDDPSHIGMDAAVRHSDNHILLVAHSDDDTAGDDLRAWDLTVDSIASPTVTRKTDIFTDQAESGQASVLINQQNDDVYAAYLKGGTWPTVTDVVFHNSTDGMDTWSAENPYSETTDDNRLVSASRTIGDAGGNVQWSWYNDDLIAIYVNLVNDILIPDIRVYELNITDPTTGSPKVVTDGDNITITFNFSIEGVDQISGVEIGDVFIGGVEAEIIGTAVTAMKVRVSDTGNSSVSNPATVVFSSMDDTDYSVLATSLAVADTVGYALTFLNKTATSNEWQVEDDGGVDIGIDFMYAAFTNDRFISNGKNIECNSETSAGLDTYNVTFASDFPSTNYAAICSVTFKVADTSACHQKSDSIPKTVAGLGFYVIDDGGNPEDTEALDWCVFEYGEYEFINFTVKSGNGTQSSAFVNVTFAENFTDTNYSVFLTDITSDPDDACFCEVHTRNVDGFGATCEDDADSTSACDGEIFDFVAIENGEFDIPEDGFNFDYIDGVGWQVNATVPNSLEGLQSLFVNATLNDIVRNDTQTNAINYGGVEQSIDIETLYPTININVTQNGFFNVSFDITCLTGECGTANVSLYYNDTGLISATPGATPFYTNDTNPLTTGSLSQGENEIVNFWLNATGSLDTYDFFFGFVNLTSNMSVSNRTDHWNVTIVAPPSDTCTYTSGNWEIECSDNCNISGAVDLGGNNISVIGTGYLSITAAITNFKKLFIRGTDSSNICRVNCNGGCFK